MPPKSLPPRRSLRTTARKSVASKWTSDLKTSLPADTPPLPSAATSSAGLPPNNPRLLLTSPDGINNPELEKSPPSQSSRTNSDAAPQEKDLVTPSGRKSIVGDEVQDRDIMNSALSVAKISCCSGADRDGNVIGGSGAEIEGKTGPEFEGKGGDETLAEINKAAIVAGELRKEGDSRTRKVVKKKVRIVKKIVTRRVPKRVVEGSVGNEEVGRVEDVGNSKEGNKNMEHEKVDPFGTAYVGTESSKPTVALEVENEDLKEINVEAMGSIKTNPSVGKEIKAMENVGNLRENELETMEVENVDQSGPFCLENENYKSNVAVAWEFENEDLKEVKVEAIESIKTSSSVENIVKGQDEEKLGVSVSKNSSEVLIAGKNDEKESERIQYQLKKQGVHFVEMKSGDLVEDRNAGTVKERQGEGGEVVKEIIEKKDVGLNGGITLIGEAEALEGEDEEALKEVVENKDVELNGVTLIGETEALEGEGEELLKEVVENNDVGLNEGVAMSAEMEALERKKRRRTEIFLGGLDKDAKEEDIRNVFEQVGKVTEVRLVMNGNTGKNKGFAFLRFASAADAKKALEKYSTVKICGKQCGARPVEGNDTLFLGNINKKWKTEDVVKLLKDVGIEKIDKVTVMANPSNFEQNRGFAFLEFETSKDAQIALSKLQKHDVFVNQMKIKVTWAQPLIEPEEEEMLKVKSVYAEYLPPSWDEEDVMDFFKRFGEIQSVSLAKNLPSARRKDFAFVNYTRREAALACIEAFSHEQVDDEGSKLMVKVSLAKPNPKAKQKKHISSTAGEGLENEKRKASQSIIQVHEPRKKGKLASSNLEGTRVDRSASTTDELLQLLRQQALVGQTRPGSSTLDYHYASPGSKRPLSALGTYPLPSDPRGFPHTYLETPHTSGSASAVSNRVGMVSLPYSQQPRTSYTLESSYGFGNDPHVKKKEQADYFGHGGIYRRY